MDLMAAYPGRQFRMLELVNYIAGRKADEREKKQTRKGVWRVLHLLQESGHVEIDNPEGRGAAAKYAWKVSFHDTEKVRHGNLESATETATIQPEKLRPHETFA